MASNLGLPPGYTLDDDQPAVPNVLDEGHPLPQAGDIGYTSGEAQLDPLGQGVLDTVATAGVAPLVSSMVDDAGAVVGNEVGSLHIPKFGSIDNTIPVPKADAIKAAQAANAEAASASQAGGTLATKANPPPQKYADGGGVVAPDAGGLPPGFTLDAEQQPNVVNQPSAQTPGGAALPPGYTLDDDTYGTPGQQFLTGVEGAAQGVFGAAAPWAETHMLQGAGGEPITTPEDIKARAETNPGTHFATELGGLAASTVAGGGLGASLGAAGEAGSAALGLGAEGAGLASRIGSSVVKGAIENAAFQSDDEATKLFLDPKQDPAQAAQTALADVGLASVIGAGAGATFGAAGALWDATVGPKVGGALATINKYVGGGGAPVSDAVTRAMDTLGIEWSPEMRATLSSDPQLQQIAKDLEQSDTTSSGLAYQQKLTDFKKRLGDSLVESTGLTPEQVQSLPEFSKAVHGENIGSTLAEEYSAKQAPIAARYDAINDTFSKKGLIPSTAEKAQIMSSDFAAANNKLTKLTRAAVKAQTSGDPGAAIDAYGAVQKQQELLKSMTKAAKAPGTVDSVADRLAQMADREGWTGSGTPIENEFNRILRQLPKQDTISGLKQLGEQVGQNTRDAPYATPLSRAGSMMRSVIDGGVEDAVTSHLSEEAPELLNEWQSTKAAYRAQAQLKDALDERLHLNGSPSNYGKLLSNAAKTDSETMARRLSGKNDSSLFGLLNDNFPKTADAVRQMHMHELLERATRKPPPGETININAMKTALQNMSPETKRFSIPPATQQKMEAVGTVLEQLAERPHNFSNSGRAAASQLINLPGSALSMAALLTGHSPLIGAIVGPLTKALGKDAPDAIKLAMLKYLGSDRPISAGGFKAAVDYAQSVARGEATLTRAVSSIFKAGKETLPAVSTATVDETSKLDRKLRLVQTNPDSLMDVGSKVAHYAPEHGQQLATTVASVTSTLNALRPNTSPKSPLDRPMPANPAQLATYNKALGFAQKPLSILGCVKNGRLTANDVQTFQSMYPALYTRVSQKLMSEAMNQHAKGNPISYQTRIALSRFCAQPMDSTLTPQAVFAAQPLPPQAQPQTATQPASNPKRSTSKLDGIAKAAETSSQARSARANKD